MQKVANSGALHFMFPTENFLEDSHPTLVSGRCLGICGEWVRTCCSLGAVLRFSQLSEDRINAAQILYESNKLLEKRVLLSFSSQVNATVPRQMDGLSKRQAVKVVLKHFRECPNNGFVVLGMVLNSKRYRTGHACAFRKFCFSIPGSQPIKEGVIYEFLDPNKGLWKSNKKREMFAHIEEVLSSKYAHFFPFGTLKFYHIPPLSPFPFSLTHLDDDCYGAGNSTENGALDNNNADTNNNSNNDINENQDIERLSTATLLYPFEGYFLGTKKKEETEKKDLECNTQPPLHSEKKKALQIMKKLTDKSFQQQHNLPNTNNKMAKLKYGEFVTIWAAFCEEQGGGLLPQFWKTIAQDTKQRVNLRE
eukprot:CAMPEP_0174257682 /NCGR_PEP_ID=MMETSP0439-20130205/6796_1 /TAXON_ID=0 /ORGANISM="Stereomyxa ramosa, Strain Chinc5" /LENGTH=363 /DNA_ID=CAMNT_0015340879 /DNA_START=28 /DNA_END=1119 /DNA_ORIENTATION=+